LGLETPALPDQQSGGLVGLTFGKVADVVVFLASDASRSITGETIAADGEPGRR